MKVYIISLGAGVLVGVVYSLLHVRSPAPPLVALVGLLGILVGEQVIPVAKQVLSGHTVSAACRQSVPPIFGMLPGRAAASSTPVGSTEGSS
ncbi:MAG: XapX domain-containing protein [Steroidobacteraceae bacterium]